MLEETRRAVEIAEGVGVLVRVLEFVFLCFIESFVSVFVPSFRSVGEVVAAPAPLSSVETPS